MIKKIRNIILTSIATVVVSCLMSGCDDKDIKELYFVGDSIISRWDLDEYFQHYVTNNQGVSGAGIDYIESLGQTETGHDVVVMIGTNNMSVDLDTEAYANRYVDAIMALDARRVFLYSVLPRDFNGEQEALLPVIKRFNTTVRSLVAGESSVCYIDVYDKFMVGGHIDYGLYYDRLHLTSSGYEILAKALEEKL